jgi:Flp pilus assembly protein TadD
MVVTLPVLLLLVDIWPLARTAAWRTRLIEKVPLLAMSAVTGIVTVLVQRQMGAVASLSALPVSTRIANAIVGYAGYLRHMVWPAGLTAFYPQQTSSPAIVWAIAAGLGAITAAAFLVRRTHPYVPVGWLWFVVALAPVSGLLQAGEQAMADRFSYVPMIGLLVIVAWGVPALAARLGVGAKSLTAAAALIVMCSAVGARAQVNTWSDSVALWRHALAVTDRNYVAHEKLGDALRDSGDFEGARAEYEQAIVFAPPGSPVYEAVIRNDLGLVAQHLGRTADAIGQFDAAARANPGFAEAQINLGNALGAAGRPSEALVHFNAAVRLAPNDAEARMGLGNVLLTLGRTDEALLAYTAAIQLAPDLAEAHNGLGGAFATAGRTAEAETQYAEALRLNPRLVTAHFNLALLLARRGDTNGAREHLNTALALDPGYAPARQLLSALARD